MKNQKKEEIKDGEYLITYTRHLEKRLRNLETEKQLWDAERIQLEQEFHRLRNKIESNKIQIVLIGTVKRQSSDENDKDRSLISKIVINKSMSKALDGIEDFSHIYIIFWMDQVKDISHLHFPGKMQDSKPIGVFATRAPIHPNPIGLTLVELVKRDENILWVKGLDAFDGTPILDIKPYPDWEHGKCIVVNDFRVPKWLKK